MAPLIDRRLDGRNKSAVNRRRFIRRYRGQLKKAVTDAMAGRSITDMDQGERVRIPSKDISEPSFGLAPGGKRQIIHPGNRDFVTGDRVKRPPSGGGRGGSKGSNTGEGQDDFTFELSRAEFLDLMFEDLALPDMVKKELARTPEYKTIRAGFTSDGVPSNINVVRSLQKSLARRIALTAPRQRQVAEAEERLEKLLLSHSEDDPAVVALVEEIAALRRRVHTVPFIDTVDLRYNNRVREPKPSSQAVMFCIMDVSGSMDQSRKDLAKRFFTLLYLFLQRNYDRIDVVFVRHHTVASEVEEEEFFYSRETGGTVVSSALKLTRDIIRERYPVSAWNIYAAQASDGDNWQDDSPGCRKLLERDLLPLMQYFAYVEITPGTHQRLWHEYEAVAAAEPNFAMKQIDGPEDIFPVFRELFRRQERA
ncbi:MAG: YeaH/YhbH family protein [Pseudomonadota bacterium]